MAGQRRQCWAVVCVNMTVPRHRPLLIHHLAQIIVNFFRRCVLLAASQHHDDLNRAASDDQSPGSKSLSASDEAVKQVARSVREGVEV